MSRIEFVEAVWSELEATGPTDFARKLGLGPDGLQKVRRWRAGGRLDYEDVMTMLQRTGWYPSMNGSVSQAPAQDRLAELAAGQEEILANQALALSVQESLVVALSALREELELARIEPPADPKRKAR